MEFMAEIRRVGQRKAASLDNIYQIVFETDDNSIMDLGKFPPDIIVKVIVEVKTDEFS